MNSIFKPYLRHFVLVFFDDILVYSDDWNSHLTHLQQVFDVLRLHKLFVKGATKIEYLGHVICQGAVSMDAIKVHCMINWPKPSSVKEVRDS